MLVLNNIFKFKHNIPIHNYASDTTTQF